jgi:hypothetical protein
MGDSNTFYLVDVTHFLGFASIMTNRGSICQYVY